MVSTLQANIISLVTAGAAIAVGFGFFGESTEQVVISVAGVVVGALFSVLNEVKTSTAVKAGAQFKDLK
jgi:hypothetical protein